LVDWYLQPALQTVGQSFYEIYVHYIKDFNMRKLLVLEFVCVMFRLCLMSPVGITHYFQYRKGRLYQESTLIGLLSARFCVSVMLTSAAYTFQERRRKVGYGLLGSIISSNGRWYRLSCATLY